jgi:hypothetical protein
VSTPSVLKRLITRLEKAYLAPYQEVMRIMHRVTRKDPVNLGGMGESEEREERGIGTSEENKRSKPVIVL